MYQGVTISTNSLGVGVGLSTNTNITTSSINLNYAANSSAQTGETKATIGNGTINLNSTITRDASTGEVTSITGSETLASNDSRTANLNRDIQANQVDNGTHFEGGYNINLSISPTVLNRAYELHQNGLLADEAKRNLSGTGEKLADLTQKVWASPNTAIGLTYGAAGYLYGAATGQEVKVTIGNNAVQFIGSQLGGNGSALTLGNAINYFGSANPDSGKTLGYQDAYYTYGTSEQPTNSSPRN